MEKSETFDGLNESAQWDHLASNIRLTAERLNISASEFERIINAGLAALAVLEGSGRTVARLDL